MTAGVSIADGALGQRWKDKALQALMTERLGLTRLIAACGSELGEAIVAAIGLIRGARGRVILTGMGKSGHVARKIAATFSSTGTPALFVHPAEASHGDLGMITRDDIVLAVSTSGESPELQDIVNHAKRFNVPLIAMTASAASTLAHAAHVVLELPDVPEACPNGLAPTTSSLLQMALGDALAVALLDDKGFSAVDFRTFHPGGKLGAQLKQVQHIMHRGPALPLAGPDLPMHDAILIMTERSFGCLGVINAEGVLTGIITDGDLRRHIDGDLKNLTTGVVMTRNPRTMTPETLASEALVIMNTARITSLFVVDADHRPLGLVHVHDLLRIGAA